MASAYRCRFCKNLKPEKKGVWKCDVVNRWFTEPDITKPHARVTPECVYDKRDTDVVTGLSHVDWITSRRSEVLTTINDVDRMSNCFKCGKEIKFKQTSIYCKDCRDQERAKDRQKISFFLDDREIVAGLVNAIIKRTFDDYKQALLNLKRAYAKKGAPIRMYWERKDQIEYYLFSKEFSNLNAQEQDIPKLILKWQKEIGFNEEDYERPND